MPGLTKLISILYGVTAAGTLISGGAKGWRVTFCGFGNISLAHHISLRIIHVLFTANSYLCNFYVYADLDLEMF